MKKIIDVCDICQVENTLLHRSNTKAASFYGEADICEDCFKHAMHIYLEQITSLVDAVDIFEEAMRARKEFLDKNKIK